MRNRNLSILLSFTVVCLILPFSAAQDATTLSWGVEEGDVIAYKMTHRTTYMGEVQTEEFGLEVRVTNLPTIPASVENLSSIPKAEIEISYDNYTSMEEVLLYPTYISVYPIGACDYIHPNEEISVDGDSITYWIEDGISYGFKHGWSNSIAIMNTSVFYSKTDGALLSFTTSWIDIASELEMEYVSIIRDDNTIALAIAGVAIGMIVIVIIIVERRR